jgi:hypothetical protein
MIAVIRWLSLAGALSGVFTLACIGGAMSALPQEEPATHDARYVAPVDCQFAAVKKSKTVHSVDCPLLPKLREQNLIYFHSLDEAAVANKTDLCPLCTQRIKNADAASIKTMPTITPIANPSAATAID